MSDRGNEIQRFIKCVRDAQFVYIRSEYTTIMGDIAQARNVAQQVLAGTVDRVELGYVVKNLTEILGDGEDE